MNLEYDSIIDSMNLDSMIVGWGICYRVCATP